MVPEDPHLPQLSIGSDAAIPFTAPLQRLSITTNTHTLSPWMGREEEDQH